LNDLDIMPTFAAGTMLVSNRAQRGREEVPAFGTPATSSALPTPEPVWNKELNKLIPGEPHVWDEESRELQKFTATGSYRAASAKSPSGNAGSEAAAPSSTAIQPAFVPASSRLTGRLNNIGTSGYPAPLAVLNLYEHAYLGSQYNVWGRKKYAANWWKHLDWNKIGRRSSQLG
jgi:Fe-Mn family superoxide dismutase